MLNNGIANIEDSANSLSITIPSKKNWFVLIFGTVWLCGWFFGLTSVLGVMGQGTDNAGVNGFLTFWLIGWSVGGAFVIFLLLWGFFGLEIIKVTEGKMTLQRSIFGAGLTNNLNTSDTKKFRFEKLDLSLFGGNRWAFWGLGAGKVKFDYGFKTYSFGLALDDAEAVHVAKLLQERISS